MSIFKNNKEFDEKRIDAGIEILRILHELQLKNKSLRLGQIMYGLGFETFNFKSGEPTDQLDMIKKTKMYQDNFF